MPIDGVVVSIPFIVHTKGQHTAIAPLPLLVPSGRVKGEHLLTSVPYRTRLPRLLVDII